MQDSGGSCNQSNDTKQRPNVLSTDEALDLISDKSIPADEKVERIVLKIGWKGKDVDDIDNGKRTLKRICKAVCADSELYELIMKKEGIIRVHICLADCANQNAPPKIYESTRYTASSPKEAMDKHDARELEQTKTQLESTRGRYTGCYFEEYLMSEAVTDWARQFWRRNREFQDQFPNPDENSSEKSMSTSVLLRKIENGEYGSSPELPTHKLVDKIMSLVEQDTRKSVLSLIKIFEFLQCGRYEEIKYNVEHAFDIFIDLALDKLHKKLTDLDNKDEPSSPSKGTNRSSQTKPWKKIIYTLFHAKPRERAKRKTNKDEGKKKKPAQSALEKNRHRT